jgi:TPR repeat protein
MKLKSFMFMGVYCIMACGQTEATVMAEAPARSPLKRSLSQFQLNVKMDLEAPLEVYPMPLNPSYMRHEPQPGARQLQKVRKKVNQKITTQQHQFIMDFYEGLETLSPDTLAPLGFDYRNKELVERTHKDNAYAYFAMHLWRQGLVIHKEFFDNYPKAIRNINARAVHHQDPQVRLAAKHVMGYVYLYVLRYRESDYYARTFFEDAGNEGYYPSCKTLGYMYEMGQNAPKDPLKSMLWYDKALKLIKPPLNEALKGECVDEFFFPKPEPMEMGDE